MITLVVAHDLNNNIGKDGELPWGRLPNDLKHFRKHTLGKHVLMGRKTFESLGEPLPDRYNYVITTNYKEMNREYKHFKRLEFFRSPEEALHYQEVFQEVFDVHWYVIGGETLYTQFLPFSDRILETLVHGKFEGCDAKFPDPFDYGHWITHDLGKELPDEKNKYGVTFRELIKEEKQCLKPTTSLFI